MNARLSQLSLFWTTLNLSTTSHSITLRSISIPLSNFPSVLPPAVFHTQTFYAFAIVPYCYIFVHVMPLDSITRVTLLDEYKLWRFSLSNFHPRPCQFLPPGTKYLPQHPIVENSLRISMFYHAFFNSIIDKHQHMHFFTLKTVLV